MIQLFKIDQSHHFCLQTDEFISRLEMSNGTNRNLTDNERRVIQNISQELNTALNSSDQGNRSILPQDLKTTTKFVMIVAE